MVQEKSLWYLQRELVEKVEDNSIRMESVEVDCNLDVMKEKDLQI